MELKSVEDTSWLQPFIKNTAPCKHESGRIRCDACPYTSSYDLAGTCGLVNQLLEPLICDPPQQHLTTSLQQATLIPKLRVHVA